MKPNFKSIFVLITLSLFVSCSSDNTAEETQTVLNKRIVINTQSDYPTEKTTQIQYFENNRVVADTTFNYQNQWISRSIIFMTGNTKTYQTLDTTGQIIAHREETYDSQGRIMSKETLVPLNFSKVTYTYHSDNTVTANLIHTSNMSSSFGGTFYKNSNGLFYKEVRPSLSHLVDMYDNTMQFDNLKPISMDYSGIDTITFDYYPNEKPIDILKTTTQLNNEVLLGLSLKMLVEEGNFYFKRNNSDANDIFTTYQTEFTEDNYIKHYKSTFLNSAINTNQFTTEVFYYYN